MVITPHLYGTSPYIPDAAYLNGAELAQQTGGNTGNLLFCHALSRMLSMGPASIGWGADTSFLDPETNTLVLPLANQLGPHVDLGNLAEVFKRVAVPMVGVGLGAQGPITGVEPERIPEGSWTWLRTLVEHARYDRPNIALRGDATMAAVRSRGFDGACVVTGCPSNMLNPSATLGREIYRRRANGVLRVMVPAGNPFLLQFAKLEQSLVKIVEKTGGTYVCQHPVDMLRLAVGDYGTVTHENLTRYRSYIAPEMSSEAFVAWFRRYAVAFSSVPEWLSAARRHDLVVGTRIHGVMAGIQAGVPSCCLCIDARTLELCQTMGIPHVDANEYRSGISIDQIQEHLRGWDWRAYDQRRVLLAKQFVEFFAWNGLSAMGAPCEIVRNASRVSASYSKKSSHPEVHQVSFASLDKRYEGIFTALAVACKEPCPTIVSFGCSDGFEPHDLATRHFHHGRVIGLEIDEDAIRIARASNVCPGRVEIQESTEEMFGRLEGGVDVVTAMGVLCRWPDSRDVENLASIYPFEKFEETVGKLVALLKPGGLLCVYNANYLVTDTKWSKNLEVISDGNFIPKTQQVRVFSKNGAPRATYEVPAVIFRRKMPPDA